MDFGGIELDAKFGGYELINKPATSLPQDLATALSSINGELLGASYEPIWYVGKQLVNGVNHKLICRQVRTTKNQDQAVVSLVVNIPAGSHGDKYSIVEIVEEENLDQDMQYAFDMALRPMVGAIYKPLAYIGKQIVKGTNFYFLCSTCRVHPSAKPYATVVCVNQFDGAFMVVSVEPLVPQVTDNKKGFAAPLGEWP